MLFKHNVKFLEVVDSLKYPEKVQLLSRNFRKFVSNPLLKAKTKFCFRKFNILFD